ncbi:molecular chaperone DnaK [Bacillus sp. FJAT-27231]|uniref:TraR/DksA C4-type zinc finger protein n=1 Tax=Bacillus sp. FJAT-27231 TaxID=1679168 RepID=UPI000670C97F|nr:TraR/DksA C4-type zinc finger protein [Bacillus sp. FJAT-27231]KMY55134.1 molecular chaperone DnaK [Bacillus sp. FJAT-27231]
MLSKEQKQLLKDDLLTQKEQLIHHKDREGTEPEAGSERDTTGELSMYDNHPADIATELHEREKNLALSDHHNNELEKVVRALEAMEKDQYGKCLECGKDISFERLQAVPTSLYCVEHTPKKTIANDRPVEEEILQPGGNGHFLHRDKEIKDYEDSFQEAAKYGTSETPSDFTRGHRDYNDLYEDIEEVTEGFTEEYENFTATDIEGEHEGFYRSTKEQRYVEELDEEGIESPLGNIPYKKKDSYLEDHK